MRKLRKYGLSPEQLETLWRKQEGKCAGCEHPLARDQAELDHDPNTGQARGYVCYKCAIVSRAVDDKERLEKITTRLHREPPAENLYATVCV